MPEELCKVCCKSHYGSLVLHSDPSPLKLQDRPSYYGQSLITFTPKSGPCKKWPLIMWRHQGANMMCCWFSWRHWWPQVPFNFYSTWVFSCPSPWLAVSVCGGAGWHSVLIHGPPLQTPCDWPPPPVAPCPLQPIMNNHLFYIVCQLWRALKLMYTVCNFSKEKSRSLGWLICSNALGQNSVLQRTLNFDYCLGLIKIYLLNPRQQDIS